ncbi:hypothetical protein CHUAL_013143 [Chamberlinius hualienensis]
MATAARCILSARLLKTRRFPSIKFATNTYCQRGFHSVLRYRNVDKRRTLYYSEQSSLLLSVTSRFISTNESSAEAAAPYIPEPPTPPVQVPDDSLVDAAVNALGEPTLSSLGLAHWTPPGLVQMGLEWLHVSMDLPWWGAIVAGTLVVRICMFPLVILAQRNAAKMNNNLPQMQILQTRFSEARRNGDHFEAMKYGHELTTFMKEKEINPLKSMLVPLAQAPVFISVFMGVRKMTNLPVMSMKAGGLYWFTDLTMSDPFYILPLLTCATLFVTLEIGAEGGMRTDNMKMMRYVLRALPIVIFPFMMNFPTALVWYWTVSNIFTLGQVAFLRIPAVREYFKISRLVHHDPGSLPEKKSFRESLKESMANVKISREIQERARVDEIQFRKAGMGPIQKTYPFDPTKQNPGKIEAKSSKKD